jgi:hypothetical protein
VAGDVAEVVDLEPVPEASAVDVLRVRDDVIGVGLVVVGVAKSVEQTRPTPV